jgi:hypothetical protein
MTMRAFLQLFQRIPQTHSRPLNPSHCRPEIKHLLQKGKGLMIVEIMIVIAIVGVLACTAIGLNVSHREKASISCIETDLSNSYKDCLVFFSDFLNDELTLGIPEVSGYRPVKT